MPAENMQERGELGRRTLLRTGLLTGAGAVVVGIAGSALARSAGAARFPGSLAAPRRATLTSSQQGVFSQDLWAWCKRCRGLFYWPNQSASWCPAPEGGRHDGSGSYNYALVVNPGATGTTSYVQAQWAWCNQCQGLFYGPHQSASWCPARPDTHHDGSGSYDYIVVLAPVPDPGDGQLDWAWCSKCQGLFYRPQQSASWCPASGQHNGSASDDYFVATDLSILEG